MLPSHATYLRLIRDSLEGNILPAVRSDYARMLAEVSSGLLARMLVEENELPELRRAALASYRVLLPDLKRLLNPASYADFEQASGGASPYAWPAFDSAARDIVRRLLDLGSTAAGCAGKLIAIDFSLREQVEAAYKAESAAGSVPESQIETFDGQQLQHLRDWLMQRFPAECNLSITGVKRLAGGNSKVTMLIQLGGTCELPASLVMRCEKRVSSTASSITTEFPLLTALHDLGVPVPRPYLLESTGQIVGMPFLLMEHLSGRIIGDFVQVKEPSPEVALDYARALARLHKAPVDRLSKYLNEGEVPVLQRVRGEIEIYEQDWKALRKSAFVMDCAYDWLKANLHLAEGHRAVVHRDVGAHNMLVDHNRVMALLDWERSTTGNPAEDLGCIYYMVGQMTDWETFIARYEQVAGFYIPEVQIDFYTLWGSVRLVTMIAKANVPILEGRLKHLQLAFAGEHYVQQLLHRVSGKLTRILEGA